MWDTIELREIRVFTLADELHFGRTADRLGLSQSRVSQSLRTLEYKLGMRLVHRTSRSVALTASGERFHGEVDLIATRLPLAQPDIVIGPILSREPRILMVASDHQLAQRDQVSLDELTAFKVAAAEDWLPPELADAFVPRVSPTGRPIGRYRPVRDLNELITLIARGKIVHPTVPSFAASFGHSNTVAVPIDDTQRSQSALAWLRRNSDPLVQEFLRIAREHAAERKRVV